jgi:hypothetical protein
VILRESRVEEAELEQQPHRLRPVAPTDVLALGVRAAVIRDRDLIDPGARLCQARGELRFDPEPLAAEPQILEDVCPHRLVTGLHVREVQVVEDVGEPREDPVPEGVPVQEHPPLRTRRESRAEDRVGSVLHDRLQEPRELRRVVFQVGVLYHRDIPGHAGDGGTDGSSLPAVDRMLEDDDPVVR